jgi:hypothetical protein
MSRITIDTNLEVETADGANLALPAMAVVETKTSGQPCVVDHFLWRVHQRPTKISKYGTGLAALTPGLPANKWNRVLRSFFGWTPERIETGLVRPEPTATDASEPVGVLPAHSQRTPSPNPESSRLRCVPSTSASQERT